MADKTVLVMDPRKRLVQGDDSLWTLLDAKGQPLPDEQQPVIGGLLRAALNTQWSKDVGELGLGQRISHDLFLAMDQSKPYPVGPQVLDVLRRAVAGAHAYWTAEDERRRVHWEYPGGQPYPELAWTPWVLGQVLAALQVGDDAVAALEAEAAEQAG